MVHGWLPGGGSSPPLSKHVFGSFITFLRLGKTSEHFLRGFGADNKLPGQFALLDLSI
jgi:hypothetical protein